MKFMVAIFLAACAGPASPDYSQEVGAACPCSAPLVCSLTQVDWQHGQAEECELPRADAYAKCPRGFIQDTSYTVSHGGMVETGFWCLVLCHKPEDCHNGLQCRMTPGLDFGLCER